ncbi:hypothetical protein [Streptomyces xylophagus]|uniref:hypothetical protein n=1 Tax=Streptomyces xylophagus TaxID=285514 RepID=UPI0018FE8F82|nr:hypothetical protein [Streptomyces xylophagus]
MVVEYVISVPGYPSRVRGRGAAADLYRGYGDVMILHSADELAVHRDPGTSVVVLKTRCTDGLSAPRGPTTTTSSP